MLEVGEVDVGDGFHGGLEHVGGVRVLAEHSCWLQRVQSKKDYRPLHRYRCRDGDRHQYSTVQYRHTRLLVMVEGSHVRRVAFDTK